MKAICIAATAFQDAGSVGSRGYTHEDTLLHAPRLIHPMRTQVAFELMVYYSSSDQKGQFAQPRELMLVCEQHSALSGPCTTRKAFHGRSVNDHNFVRTSIQKATRNG